MSAMTASPFAGAEPGGGRRPRERRLQGRLTRPGGAVHRAPQARRGPSERARRGSGPRRSRLTAPAAGPGRTSRSRRSRGRSHSDGGKSQATPKPRSAGRGARPRTGRGGSIVRRGRWRRSGNRGRRGPRRWSVVGTRRGPPATPRRGGGDQPRHREGRLLPSLAGAMSGPLSPTPTRPRAEPLDRCEEHRRSGGTAVVDRVPIEAPEPTSADVVWLYDPALDDDRR